MAAAHNIPFKASSGRQGRIVCNGAIVNAGEWTTQVNATDITIRTFELTKPGFDYGLPGIIGCDWNWNGPWNILQNIHVPPIAVNAGLLLNNLELWLNRNPAINLFWAFPESHILGGSMQCKMDEYINYNPSGKTNGNWFFPGGIEATVNEL